MPSHAARACATPIADVVAAQRFDAGAHGNAIGLFLLERAALPFGIGARRFVGGEPLANDVRRVLEVGLDRVLDVGIGKQLDPRHARRRRTPRAAGRNRRSTTSRVICATMSRAFC